MPPNNQSSGSNRRLPQVPIRRIETQIHRRSKAKKVFPLESEWDAETGAPPESLRMPASNMDRNRRPNR
jgi:hypothetical protein